MQILKFPHDILRESIPLFDFNNTDIDPIELEQNMIATMFANGGIGLAANQVGVRARMFVMGSKEMPESAQAFFNPEVVANVTDMEDLEEGCLSFPGTFVKIKRPKKILARWQNSKGQVQESEFEGYDCKCFLHELDHLEGIVFKDRVTPLKWALAVKKTKKGKFK